MICAPLGIMTVLSFDDTASKSQVSYILHLKMEINFFLIITQGHKWVNSDAELAFIFVVNLFFSRTSGADFPELVLVGEGKMAAMVLLLNQSRYCNSNHY